MLPDCQHRYRETYYGYECDWCADFIPYGCEPWVDWEEPESEYGFGGGLIGDWGESDEDLEP